MVAEGKKAWMYVQVQVWRLVCLLKTFKAGEARLSAIHSVHVHIHIYCNVGLAAGCLGRQCCSR